MWYFINIKVLLVTVLHLIGPKDQRKPRNKFGFQTLSKCISGFLIGVLLTSNFKWMGYLTMPLWSKLLFFVWVFLKRTSLKTMSLLKMFCRVFIMNTLSEHCHSLLDRSTRPKVFCKKGALKNFVKFTGKNLCPSLFFRERDSGSGVFPWI